MLITYADIEWLYAIKLDDKAALWLQYVSITSSMLFSSFFSQIGQLSRWLDFKF